MKPIDSPLSSCESSFPSFHFLTSTWMHHATHLAREKDDQGTFRCCTIFQGARQVTLSPPSDPPRGVRSQPVAVSSLQRRVTSACLSTSFLPNFFGSLSSTHRSAQIRLQNRGRSYVPVAGTRDDEVPVHASSSSAYGELHDVHHHAQRGRESEKGTGPEGHQQGRTASRANLNVCVWK